MTTDFIPPPRPEGEAEFNSAFAFLERLNKIEYMIEDALMDWDVKRAFACLESYENELSVFFKPDEKIKVAKIENEIIKIFNKNPLMGQKQRFSGKVQVIGSEAMSEARIKIVELNQYLRQIKHKNGMMMPKKGDQKLF